MNFIKKHILDIKKVSTETGFKISIKIKRLTFILFSVLALINCFNLYDESILAVVVQALFLVILALSAIFYHEKDEDVFFEFKRKK